MPVNKDALKRYRIIDRLLSNPNRDFTTEQILKYVNQECPNVSKRMIQKDIKALEEEFGKQMVRNAGGRGTVRYADQSEPLFYQQLTEDEEEVLREVLRSIGQFEGLDNFTWLDLLRKKLEMKENGSELPYISFSKNEGLCMPPTLLGRLFNAIARKQVIKLTYTPFGKAPRQFSVHPYQLKQFNDRWFLLCCPLGSEQFPFNPEFIMNLPLDRISEQFTYLDEEEYIPTPVDLKARFDEIIGVTLIMENEIEDIYFAVKAEQLDYIRTKWLHTTQIELDEESQEEYRAKYPSLRDCVFFSIECRENNELYNRFASYSDSLVLVEPEYMRNRLQKKLASAAANYDMD